MKVVIKESWCEATGNQHLIGVELTAKLDQAGSFGPMGNCYTVSKPHYKGGRLWDWTVYSSRIESVIE